MWAMQDRQMRVNFHLVLALNVLHPTLTLFTKISILLEIIYLIVSLPVNKYIPSIYNKTFLLDTVRVCC